MIIEALFNMIYSVITTVLDFVSIPALDQTLINNVNSILNDIIDFSKNLINLFMPYSIAVILGTIVLVIETAYLIYCLVMWVLRKIPVVSIE